MNEVLDEVGVCPILHGNRIKAIDSHMHILTHGPLLKICLINISVSPNNIFTFINQSILLGYKV